MGREQLGYQEYYDYAVRLLRKQPVMSLQALEGAVAKRFKASMTATHHEDMQGRKRKRWENLVDWVKAMLTRRALIRYVIKDRTTYVVYLEGCGSVHGRLLCDLVHASEIIDTLAEVLGAKLR